MIMAIVAHSKLDNLYLIPWIFLLQFCYSILFNNASHGHDSRQVYFWWMEKKRETYVERYVTHVQRVCKCSEIGLTIRREVYTNRLVNRLLLFISACVCARKIGCFFEVRWMKWMNAIVNNNQTHCVHDWTCFILFILKMQRYDTIIGLWMHI